MYLSIQQFFFHLQFLPIQFSSFFTNKPYKKLQSLKKLIVTKVWCYSKMLYWKSGNWFDWDKIVVNWVFLSWVENKKIAQLSFYSEILFNDRNLKIEGKLIGRNFLKFSLEFLFRQGSEVLMGSKISGSFWLEFGENFF